ncbi:non-ribosomal peptide synthetase [Modestobacter sp. Leaf380]|uniref:non-ribosomal peptide synthetase n=1 Tax=Modestobacter sp. Leaf380 TaxID=1736356 RepID=UPI0006FC6A8D|nr:non-ribosomal peptide synthetase [Modestobacter sp. Leaf380]KQS71306.1 hypothetical protein ASG41_20070 [Modestobacter sp. Leaf380]
MTGQVDALPASSGQERLWLAEQLVPGAALYNVHLTHRLRGRLRPELLDTALQAVVDRHEVLRTTLRALDGRPRQVVAARLRVPTVLGDLRAEPSGDRLAAVRGRAAAQAATAFDLAAGPLLRSELLQLDDDDHAWLLTLHHAVCDAWSTALLLGEVSTVYGALVTGTGPELPELALQYADYAIWQREEQDARASASMDHWRRSLRDHPPLLPLPVDRPRPPVQSHRGALLEAEVPAPLGDAVRELARRQRATTFATLLAAFAVWVHRCSGAEDMVVGTAVGGRPRPELGPLIGFFAETVALRIAVRRTDTFADVLARTAEVVLDAQVHALPFDEVVREVRPDRDPSHHPVFQVMFDVQPGGPGTLRLPGVAVTAVPVPDRRVALFDLGLSVVEGDRLRLVAEYATDLLDRGTVEGYLSAYLDVLAEVVANPGCRVGARPGARFDGSDERHDRRRAASAPRTLVESFADSVRRTPHAPALLEAATGAQVDYATLDAWSGHVAAGVVDAGVGPGDVVAIHLPRSAAAVAAVLGVLRAGVAYLPVTPGTPTARTATLLSDSGARAVLTGAEDRAAVADLVAGLGVGVPVLAVPVGPPDVARVPPPVRVDPDDIAYVLFTSGSTGAPKGVLVPHRGVANYAVADCRAHGLGPTDRVLQFTDLQFDVSAEELFPALDVGACVVLRTEQMVDTARDFLEAARRWGVTVAHLPTAWFHELVVAADRDGTPVPPALRLLVVGGEATTPTHLATWVRAAPHVSVGNAYGPTETTIAATLAPLAGPGARPGTQIPIGDPVPGAAVFVLDPELAPVPAGGTGELFVGGAGLARGYLGRPDLTADRFVPDPTGTGGRLYRTGDRARVLADGRREFVGRVDDQVKIRGHRVEPGEVEAVLAAADGVRHAAVVAHHGPRGTELHAYVEPLDAAAPVDELRVRLRTHLVALLPAYLVPAAITVLAELPRTGTDKVDRARLPRPSGGGRAGSAPPATDAERVVAAVWEDVLARTGVGRDDDFFELGGHSLLAGQAVSRLQRHFGRHVTLRQVFEHPRLAAFAAAVAGERAADPRPALRRASGAELLAGVLEAPRPVVRRVRGDGA